jgi:hypothetical protein
MMPVRIAAILLLFFSAVHAQSWAEFTLAAFSLRNGQAVELDKLP